MVVGGLVKVATYAAPDVGTDVSCIAAVVVFGADATDADEFCGRNTDAEEHAPSSLSSSSHAILPSNVCFSLLVENW